MSHVHQGVLETVVRSLFKNENVLYNTRKQSSLLNPATNLYLEVDIWLPHRNLCFEFQDPYHYIHTWDSNVPTDFVQERDKFKQDKIQLRGESLILVPCWWDGQEASLVASIQFCRPDLLTGFEFKEPIWPIDLNPGFDFFASLEGFVPGIGELMLASFPNPINFTDSVSADSSWWLGEKYDGVRCCWNGTAKALYNRAASKIQLPHNFKALLGTQFLDAEIWVGRGYFPEAQLVSSCWNLEELAFMRLICFDDPNFSNREHPFEERYADLITAISKEHAFLILAFRVLCYQKQHLTEVTQEIIDDGGEGVILRLPCSPYINGRNQYLLKFKASRVDKEAMVFKIDSFGDPTLLLPDGTTFKAQSQGNEMRAGDIVTFSYESYSSLALPVNPIVTRIRQDKTWRDVIREQNTVNDPQYSDTTQKYLKLPAKKPSGYWLSDERRSMLEVFENFAKSRNFDPLIAQNWYAISKRVFLKTKHAFSIVGNFGGSFISALLHLFPDIGLDERKFMFLRRNYWKDPKNRRNFYLKFAQLHGFDPFVSSNWYKYNVRHIMATKGAAILGYYQGSYGKSLTHLFPEVSFNFRYFVSWKDRDKRRNYFEQLAQTQGINPLLPAAWYSIHLEKFESRKSIRNIMKLFQQSLPRAIIDAFPEIGLEEHKFPRVKNPHFNGKSAKHFFIDLAKWKDFDPLVADNWYPISWEEVLKFKGATSVLSHYKGSFTKALMEQFPNIGLDIHGFKFLPKNYWQSIPNRKKFFFDLAKRKGFDPLITKNWYTISQDDILTSKGALALGNYYEGSYYAALVHLFPDLKFEKTKFAMLRNHKFHNISDRRKYLESIARAQGLDPLIPEHWYKIAAEDKLKDTTTLLSFYKSSFGRMLTHLFPDIGLDMRRFYKSKKRKH